LSTDWWTNPDREFQKLEEALDQAQRSSREVDEPPEDTEEPEVLAEGWQGSVFASASAPGEDHVEAEPSKALAEGEGLEPGELRAVYRPLQVQKSYGSVQDFYESGSSSRIKETIARVVQVEGPIKLELAAKRVTSFWGFGRVGKRALDRVRSLVPKDKVNIQKTKIGTFLWPADQDPDTYAGFRIPGDDPDSQRSPEDLPVEEVANAALHVLGQEISLPLEDLARSTSRVFGFQRAGPVVQDRMQRGIRLLADKGAAVIDQSTVIIATK
jgi:hypothetical protein